MTQVLIVHASKYGSVEEVARYVAWIVRDDGAVCDVVAARDAVDTVKEVASDPAAVVGKVAEAVSEKKSSS